MLRKHPGWRIFVAYYIIASAADGYAVGRAIDSLVGVVVGLVMALLPVFIVTSVSTSRKIALWILPLVIAVATAFVVRRIAHEYPNDPAARWGAIGAVLVAATLVVALAGLPLALAQLFSLSQDVARLRQESNERRLNAHVLAGLALLEPGAATASWFADYQKWVDAGPTQSPRTALSPVQAAATCMRASATASGSVIIRS
jgi:hypothetical protein